MTDFVIVLITRVEYNMRRTRGKSPVVSSDEERTTDSNESYSPRPQYETRLSKRLDKEKNQEGRIL